jgi:hypothetical protein
VTGAELATAQVELRRRVADQLVGQIQSVEARSGARLGDLDAEMLTTSLVNDAVGAYVRTCLASGRPVPSDEEEEQLARTVADDLLTPSQFFGNSPTCRFWHNRRSESLFA